MDDRINRRLDSFSEEMLLHYAAPNQSMIVELMQFDASALSSLTQQDIAQYIFVLGQYLVLLQHNENKKNIEHKLAQKDYEFNLSKEKFIREDVGGKSEKERNNWIIINVPAIKELHDEVLAKEAEKMLIDGMVRAVEGLLNALKKEISLRFSA